MATFAVLVRVPRKCFPSRVIHVAAESGDQALEMASNYTPGARVIGIMPHGRRAV